MAAQLSTNHNKKDNESVHTFIQEYITEIHHILNELDETSIETALNILMEAYRGGYKVFIIGNGGSASTASHMSCDLSKNTLTRAYDNNEKRFRVMSLTDNIALMTAFANDLSYADIFIQQLRNLIDRNDVLIAMSGSGNSVNIVKAVKYAKSRKAKTIGLLGFKNGGKVAKLVDCPIIIQSNKYGPIEDVHLILSHIMSALLAKAKKQHDHINHTRQKK